MRKNSPIQKKIMTVIMLTSGIVLIMTCTAFFIYEYVSARESARRQLSTLARVIASNSIGAFRDNNREEGEETLNSLIAEGHILEACLYDTSGNIFAKFPDNIQSSDLPTAPFNNEYKFSGKHLSGFEPITSRGQLLGVLYLKSDVERLYDRFLLYAIIAVVFIGISFFFAYFISRRLQESISTPILDLADVSRTVSEKSNYSVRARKTSDDEVGELTDAFNHMLTRIEIQNDEITKLNQNLEQKVRERTHELEVAIEELERQTEFSGKIFDSTVDLIAVFDTELRYVTMNKHSEVMYQKTRDEVKGKYMAELFPQTQTSGMIDDLRAALGGQIIRRMNYRSLVTNRVYESYYIPLKDANNKVYSVMAIAHDITDIIHANEKLQRLNDELEKSNGELEQFAYVASHDLQEPLRKIQTFTELGQRSINDPVSLGKYLAKVSTSAQRMTELIKAVLNFSRLSKTDQQFIQVDLNSVLKDIFSDLELLLEEENAVIECGTLPILRGIPLQIHQLFLNLITNSIKFNDAQPKITITAVTGKGADFDNKLALNKDRMYVMLKFTDNGIGFEQKFADKIFSIFQRLHNDRSFSGTGIGLALCKKIVDNHDGRIAVESEPGKGTTFRIFLPQ